MIERVGCDHWNRRHVRCCMHRDPSGGGGCHQHLAAPADVEHADAEGECHAQAGRDQRCREGERLGERLDGPRG